MFDIAPKCPALTSKLSGIFSWRHTYKVSAKHEGITHAYLQKSYSLTLPTKRPLTPECFKDPESWVSVHHLQTQCGILDPDDCVRDVADDREYIHASFEDSGLDPGVAQGGGDGASGSSSVGTGSPDIFRDPTNRGAPTNGARTDNCTPHIEVTSTTLCPVLGMGLQVRRSSDPNVLATLKTTENSNKRWSAAAPHCADSPERIHNDKSGYLSPQWEEDDDSHQQVQTSLTQQAFSRSGRLSMQFLGDGSGHKWIEAAEKIQQNQLPNYMMAISSHHQQQQLQQSQHHQQQQQFFISKSLPRESKRKEPLGQAYESIREKDGEMLLLINERGSALGLNAIPDKSNNGGLLVQYVEPGSIADLGRLRRGDRILEINGHKLAGLSDTKIRQYLEARELRVRVIRADLKNSKSRRKDSKVAEMIEAEEKLASGYETKVATVSPTRKPHTAPAGSSLQIANTRKLGRKIEIILKKGPNGLGFSVTTRDNPAGGHSPIYIKNILPSGAAIDDGRLRPGDRLLEVDDIPVTGKTQTEVVSLLREKKTGATVRLVVSRQRDLSDESEEREINVEDKEVGFEPPSKPPPPVLPPTKKKSSNDIKKSNSARSLLEQHQQHQMNNLNESQHFIDAGSESATSNDSLQAGIVWRSREMLTLHIPVHDTEKAGLGVSVKGKTSSNINNSTNDSNSQTSIKHDGDLGIFVKNVIHGGAASRDGRLRMNDQLISVNGASLLGQSNAEAMNTLKRAIVNKPGKHPGTITLQVARKISRSCSDNLDKSNESSNTSENSGATVVYLSPEKRSDEKALNSEYNVKTDIEFCRWSNPVLDRLTGGACSTNSSNKASKPLNVMAAPSNTLRNESYYMATNDTWSPALHHAGATHIHNDNGHVNNSVLIEDDPEPISPTIPHLANDTTLTNNTTNVGTGAAPHFDATYSSQLSLETNNSGVEHFSRDALGRRSISEKHHAALDARETGTYQRNRKLREDRERERRLQLTKSAVFGGSMESLTARIAQANAAIPGYKHVKTASSIEQQQQQQLQAEARDQIADLGPSLGLKKSSSLESLQTMVQEIQMSDEPRGGPTMLRAPRGRGREECLRAAVASDHDVNRARKHWLLEEADANDGGFTQRNSPFQSSLNDGKVKVRTKKPGILRGIGSMFRFGKNRKDSVMPVEISAPVVTSSTSNKIPAAALAAMERNEKLPPPAYQPPPPLPSGNHIGPGDSHTLINNESNVNVMNGIHQNDLFNHRYQHYSNYEELHNHRQLQHQQQQQHQHQYHQQISNDNTSNDEVLSETTLESMRQQVLRQRIKVETESRRYQHYHSQRSARSQDMQMPNHYQNHHNNNNNNNNSSNNKNNDNIKSIPNYYDYETVQHNIKPNGNFHHRTGSIKVNEINSSNSSSNMCANKSNNNNNNNNNHMNSGNVQTAHWKLANMNGFSPATLNSSARCRGPFVTHVTLGGSNHSNNNNNNNNNTAAAIAVGQQQQHAEPQHPQPMYQTVQKSYHTNKLHNAAMQQHSYPGNAITEQQQQQHQQQQHQQQQHHTAAKV